MFSMHDQPVIDELTVPTCSGPLGLTACPGGFGYSLEGDLAALHRWGGHALVTLVERHELEWLGITRLGEAARAEGLEWYHLPVPDFCAPDRRFEHGWQAHRDAILAHLHAGRGVVLHCLAGLGRTGTVAARILTEFGVAPADAIRHVRNARPGAIQSIDQEDYVLNQRWRSTV